MKRLILLLSMALGCSPLPAQTTPARPRTPSAPAAPTTFHDPAYKISFDYPGDWVFARRDREISTFRLDARSAPKTTVLRAVASMPENPFPESTFSGAYIYLSVTPRSNDALCAKQAASTTGRRPSPAPRSPASGKPGVSDIAGIPFAHGHDEQKNICTTQRDEVYTTLRRGACYRFDLAINTFCGGQVSGVKDINEKELNEVHRRLESILATARFDPK